MADASSSPSTAPSQATGDPINSATGNNYRREVDYQLPGTLGLAVIRHYNSRGTGSATLGTGWQLGPDASLTLQTPTHGHPRIQIAQGDGRTLDFESNAALGADGQIPRGEATYRSPRVEDGVVRYQNHEWTWQWADGRSLHFGRHGALLTIEDGHGARLQFGHGSDGRLLGWRDQTGRTVRFVYEGLGQYGQVAHTGRLSEVVLPDGHKIEYHYDTQGQLTGVDEPDGRQWRYSYRFGLLTEVRDAHNVIRARYAYDGAGNATHTEDAGGANAIDIRMDGQSAKKAGGDHNTIIHTAAGDTTYRFRQVGNDYVTTSAAGPGCPTCAESNVEYGYDKDGRLLSATQQDGSELRIVRDAMGREIGAWKRIGRGKEVEIERRRYLRADDPLSPVAEIDRPSVAPQQWLKIELAYDAHDRLIDRTDNGWGPDLSKLEGNAQVKGWVPVLRHYHYEWDDAGRLTKAVDPAGDATRYRYDSQGQLVFIERPEGLNERLGYDNLGRVSDRWPADGVKVHYEYDIASRVVSQTRGDLTRNYQYDDNGHLVSMRLPDGSKVTSEYDPAGKLIALRYPDGHKQTYGYDANNRVNELNWLDAEGHVILDPVHFEMPGRGQESRMIDANGGIYRMTIDESGRTTRMQEPETQAVNFAYDEAGDLARRSQGDVTLRYLVDGLESRDTTPGGTGLGGTRQRTFRDLRDDFGNAWATINADSGLTVRRFDAMGRMVLSVNESRQVTRVIYDHAGRTVMVDHPRSPTAVANPVDAMTIFYVGNYVLRVETEQQADTYAYDPDGRMVQHDERLRAIDGKFWYYRTRNAYDTVGNLERVELPNGHVMRYAYSAGGRAVTVELDGKALASNIDYFSMPDGTAPVSQLTYGNGLHRKRNFDRAGQITEQDTDGVGAEHYRYDSDRRMVNYESPLQSLQFKYDDLGRLQQQDRTLGNQRSQENYAYDSANNRIGLERDGVVNAEIVARDSDRLLGVLHVPSGGTPATGGLIKTAWKPNEARLSPNAWLSDGAQIVNGSFRLYPAANGRAMQVDYGKQMLVSYRYNYMGERIGRITQHEARYYLYDNHRISAEIDERGRIVVQYVYLQDGHQVAPIARVDSDADDSAAYQARAFDYQSDKVSFATRARLAVKHAFASLHLATDAPSSTRYFLHTDWREAPNTVTDEHGKVVWQATYDAWGKTRISYARAGFKQNLRMAGQYFDDMTGWYNNYLRDYNPDTGRYMSPDPAGLRGGLNGYAYVNGDPVNRLDPLGLYQIDIHYYMTYFLAIEAGWPPEQAEYVALAAQYVDDNPNTSPTPYGAGVFTPFDTYKSLSQNIPALLQYHFVLTSGVDAPVPAQWNNSDVNSVDPNAVADGTAQINGQLSAQLLNLLCASQVQQTVSAGKNDQMQFFGEYLHAYEDTYAHRDSNSVPVPATKTVAGNSFGIGHGGYGENPDFTYNHTGFPAGAIGGLSGHIIWDQNEGRTLDMEEAVFYQLQQEAKTLGFIGATTPTPASQVKISGQSLISILTNFNRIEESEDDTGKDGIFASNSNSNPVEDGDGASSNNTTNDKLKVLNLALEAGGNADLNYYDIAQACINRNDSVFQLANQQSSTTYLGIIFNTPQACPGERGTTPAAELTVGPTLTAGPATGQFTAKWDPSTATENGMVSGYTLNCTSSDGTSNFSITTTKVTAVVSGATPGATYTCTVETTYTKGDPTNSLVSDPVTLPKGSPLPPVADPVITNITPSDGQLTVSLNGPDVSPQNGSPAVGYTVNCVPPDGSDNNAYGTNDNSLPNSVMVTLPHVVSGLTNGVAYTCSVTEYFQSGSPITSAAAAPATPVAPPEKGPAIVSTQDTSGNGQGSVSVTFTPIQSTTAADGGSVVTGYKVACKPTSPVPATTLAPIDVDAGDQVSGNGGNITHRIEGLVNGVSYKCFAVGSNAAGGSPPSDSVSVGPINVGTYPPPSNVQATVANGQATVTFNPVPASANDPVNGYSIIAIAVAPPPGYPSVTRTFCTSNSCTVPNISPAMSYMFQVQTMNVNGNGVASPSITVNMPTQ